MKVAISLFVVALAVLLPVATAGGSTGPQETVVQGAPVQDVPAGPGSVARPHLVASHRVETYPPVATVPDRVQPGLLQAPRPEPVHTLPHPAPVQAAALEPTTALALLALLLWKGKALAAVFVGMFSRLEMDSALEHPKRRALFDYIDENPGTTFRELIRSTDMAAGTARHHLVILIRCEVLVELSVGQTLRYFHCDQDQIGDWDAVVVLREPNLDRIYRWLLDHPGVMQRQILDEAETWGWRRSTAQHRLKRLVDNGLALVRDLGRNKSYQARVVDVR